MEPGFPPEEQEKKEPRWQPLSAIDRRVVGVLAEKAKTTPDAYPMTVNAIRTGCNQKSNRHPLMQLEVEDVEESLDRLREAGVVTFVEGYGRATKYRHYLYDWLGVDKVELAVMTELLLRGAQTVGELRGRAARMEPIRDLSELKPIVDSLIEKGLVISLTPEGRGQVVTHALYAPRELEKLQAEYQGGAPAAPAAGESTAPAPAAEKSPPVARHTSAGVDTLQAEVAELRAEVGELRQGFAALQEAMRRMEDELAHLKSELGS